MRTRYRSRRVVSKESQFHIIWVYRRFRLMASWRKCVSFVFQSDHLKIWKAFLYQLKREQSIGNRQCVNGNNMVYNSRTRRFNLYQGDGKIGGTNTKVI